MFRKIKKKYAVPQTKTNNTTVAFVIKKKLIRKKKNINVTVNTCKSQKRKKTVTINCSKELKTNFLVILKFVFKSY